MGFGADHGERAARRQTAYVVWVDDGPDGGFVAYSGFTPQVTGSGTTISETLEDFVTRYKEWLHA